MLPICGGGRPVAEPLRPRAFISYRHAEHENVPDAARLNADHRLWVEQFCRELTQHGVDAIYDAQLREFFRPHTARDPQLVPFLAEVSTISCLVCHAFIPILTPSYIGRLGFADYQRQDSATQSFVFEEWQTGCFYANAGVMQFVPIVRAGDHELMAALPQLGVGPENGFDMRDPAHFQAQVGFIAERIMRAWDGGPALITLSLEEWVSRYIDWCRGNYPGCADQKVDDWQVDLLRPRLFIEAALGPK
jgi:hypothetical protein